MTTPSSFTAKIHAQWVEKKFLCIGLDPHYSKLPTHLQNLDVTNAFFTFNKELVDATSDVVCAYKPQIAFYAAEGDKGLRALRQTLDYIHNTYPDIPVILDAKRGDIGSTSEAYVKEAFDVYRADAVTVNPYLGLDSLEPFLERKEKGVIILCRTSNPGASDFQDLLVDDRPLFLHVAEKVSLWHKTYQNCLLVVGATWPEQMAQIRRAAPDVAFLIPGIGTQGGSLTDAVKNGLTKDTTGIIINVARDIIYASHGEDFAKKAREKANYYHDQILHAL